MGYYDNVKDSIREENGGSDSDSSESEETVEGNFDTLREAAEETDVEDEGGDDTPIEVLEEEGLGKQAPSRKKRNEKKAEKSEKMRKDEKTRETEKSERNSRERSRQEKSSSTEEKEDVDQDISDSSSELEEKLDKIIEQNARMIEILEGFGN